MFASPEMPPLDDGEMDRLVRRIHRHTLTEEGTGCRLWQAGRAPNGAPFVIHEGWRLNLRELLFADLVPAHAARGADVSHTFALRCRSPHCLLAAHASYSRSVRMKPEKYAVWLQQQRDGAAHRRAGQRPRINVPGRST